MQFPDGEYDIDLLVLANESSDLGNNTFAIRYGFIPDSMDQSSSLRLYQSDQVCVLEAQLTDKSHKTGVRALPIIFEGVPQRQRMNSGSAISPDSYFLAFNTTTQGPSGMKVLLQRLSNTVRVSKSRNAEKWRTAISEWKECAKNSPFTGLIEVPNVPQQREVATPPPSRVKKVKAQKRPPTATPETKNDIISVSDFEDLDSTPESGFPIFDMEPKKVVVKPNVQEPKPHVRRIQEPQVKSNSQQKPQQKPLVSQQTAQKAQMSQPRAQHQARAQKSQPKPQPVSAQPKRRNSKTKKRESDDIDMDDDFKDLEDQLQEVLEESGPKTVNISDSDEDEDPFSGGPIIIKVSEDKAPRKPGLGQMSSNRKPMSMRDLYGGNKNEDISSSEEE